MLMPFPPLPPLPSPLSLPVYLQATGGTEWNALGELVKVTGLPVAILILILVAGAKGWWLFGGTVKQIIAGYDIRIAEYKEEIAYLKGINEKSAQTFASLIDQIHKLTVAQERSERRAGRDARRDG